MPRRAAAFAIALLAVVWSAAQAAVPRLVMVSGLR
jgi:hypothetical protein